MLLMTIKCTTCFQEIAGGPPSAATATYLQSVAQEHTCQTLEPASVPSEPSTPPPSLGQLSPEEMAQLGLNTE